MDDSTKPPFLGRLRFDWLTSNQTVDWSVDEGTSSPSISPGPQWAGA